MRTPRPWKLSEVNVAARALLALEREAAQARMMAGTHGEIRQGSRALGSVASRWGRGRDWLEWLLKASSAAAADPTRLAPVLGFMDAGGAPNVAWRWIQENDGRPAGELSPLPPIGASREIVSGAWRLSDVDVVARALLDSRLSPPQASNVIVLAPSERQRRRALTDVAALWGKPADWLQKILDVCRAAEAGPDRFRRLVDVMDKAGRPQAAWTRMTKLFDEERVSALVPVPGRFHTLVMDVPWREDNISEASDHGYAQMSFEEILGLKPLIDAWVADGNCHLWFWAKNNTTGLAHKAIEHYGFEFRISHIWTKPMGRGRYARNSHESVLFATRGDRKCKLAYQRTPTHHAWPRPTGPESSKPDGFYQMVTELSYPPYGEAFQRLARPGFVNLYRSDAPAAALEAGE